MSESPKINEHNNLRLGNDEIRFLKENQSWMPGNITYLNSYLDSRRDNVLAPFLEYISTHNVIEIGPGGHPFNEFVKCGSYVGVQPFKCYVSDIEADKYVIEDGLSYLREQPDHSAVVVSFGVMDTSVLDHSMYSHHSDLPIRYMKELAEEIRRVSSPFAIVVGLDTLEFMGQPDYAKSNYAGEEGRAGGVYICDDDKMEEVPNLS